MRLQWTMIQGKNRTHEDIRRLQTQTQYH